MTIQEFFGSLPERIEPSRTAGMTGRYLFDVEGVGQWTVSVDDGTVMVEEGAGGAPDCTISASEKTLTKIVNRESNATTAFMMGKLKIDGDMGAALKLQKLF